MNFHKKHFVLNSIFYACLCIFSILGSIATASESQVLTVEEIEKGAIDKLASVLPWDRESLEINVYYEGEDILLPPGKKELVYKTRGSNQKAGRIPLILQIKVNGNFKKSASSFSHLCPIFPSQHILHIFFSIHFLITWKNLQ